MTEVQTLGGNWGLWLIPLFLLCLVLIVLSSRSELGCGRKRRNTAPAAAPEKNAAPVCEEKPQEPDQEIDEVLVLAAAAYMMTEKRYGGNKMKNLKITVNGKTYDVTVEEEGGSYDRTPRYTPPKAAAPAPVKAAPAAAAPVQAAAPAPVKAAAPAAGGQKLEAPMSGRVVEITAPVGTAVKKGDTVLIMEAMKLQSEVCSDFDGVVSQILVKEKQDVSTGDILAVIE